MPISSTKNNEKETAFTPNKVNNCFIQTSTLIRTNRSVFGWEKIINTSYTRKSGKENKKV